METFHLEDYIEVDSLDFITKYAIIITNFIIIITLVIYNKYFRTNKDTSNEKHDILLIVSVPSDLVFYYLPTILNHKNEYNFHILCLSSGFPAEEQKIKEKEFEKCCQFLELKKFLLLQEDLLLYNEAKTWPISYISNKIIDYIQINNIKAIIAFDEYAINGESGRNAISKAIRLMTLDEEKKAKLPDGIKIYELITVNFLRRWFGIWDFLFCVLQYYVYLNTNPFKNYKTLGLLDSLNTVFYKIRLFFSRYSFVNTLKRIK